MLQLKVANGETYFLSSHSKSKSVYMFSRVHVNKLNYPKREFLNLVKKIKQQQRQKLKIFLHGLAFFLHVKDKRKFKMEIFGNVD